MPMTIGVVLGGLEFDEVVLLLVHAATTRPNVIAAPTVLNRPPDISPPSFSCKPLQSRMLRTERPDVKRVQRGSEGGRRLSDDQLGGDQHRLRLLIRMLG